nr:uncharacterized protein LOC123773386 [Procambarus clarkii]XP_045623076.1 uncharacterized protein LOC123773386 [Procambarus clarkii]XP_045623086.1 uncharacterized protein LOC123773386 [Procambarus clarkii]XP_045623094.1 uncharacterized protein LOC123773386 [Procambarus clarkii]
MARVMASQNHSEQEVKIIESCEWEASSAREMLLVMPDVGNRLSSVQDADSILRNSPTQSDALPVDGSRDYQTGSSGRSNANFEQLNSESFNIYNKPVSQKSTKSEINILPESLATGTVPRVSSESANINMGAYVSTTTYKSRNEAESASSQNSLGGMYSGSSSNYLSPHRSAFESDFKVNREHDTSECLTPELIPIGFNQNASVNNNYLWHSGMSSNAVQTSQISSKIKQKITLNKKMKL